MPVGQGSQQRPLQVAPHPAPPTAGPDHRMPLACAQVIKARSSHPNNRPHTSLPLIYHRQPQASSNERH